MWSSRAVVFTCALASDSIAAEMVCSTVVPELQASATVPSYPRVETLTVVPVRLEHLTFSSAPGWLRLKVITKFVVGQPVASAITKLVAPDVMSAVIDVGTAVPTICSKAMSVFFRENADGDFHLVEIEVFKDLTTTSTWVLPGVHIAFENSNVVDTANQ